ncbi:MAG: isoamylase early set domain-containing protein, partial [bacterium]
MKTALVSVAMVLLAFSCTYGGTAKAPDGIEFSYTDPAAASVSVAGSFNNWDSNANPMTKGDDGVWTTVIPLAPDTYEYKFVVNGGDWMADPDNPKIVGDYGNSELTINEDGEPVTTGVAVAITNTPVNSRVLITGWLRALYGARKSVLGDTRYRGERPVHASYVSFNPTIGSDVKGSATIKLDTGEGDIREITADLFSGWLKYKGPGFAITGYHNEELLVFDDPLKIVGDIELPGSVEGDMIEYGRGTQGFKGDLEFGKFDATVFVSDTQDGSIFNSPHRFDCSGWGADCDTVLRYDNIGTDNIGVRAKYELAGARWGVSFLTERNGWWVPFDIEDNIEPDALKTYRAETGDTLSTWFE